MLYKIAKTIEFLIIRLKRQNDIDCDIPVSTTFPHPYGIVIHPHAKIGENCVINQNVTIGNRKGYKSGVPTIGNNVHIFSHAVILGNIKIGDNTIIGAHSLVLTDIPRNSVAYGIPAKVIRTVEDNKIYTPRVKSKK